MEFLWLSVLRNFRFWAPTCPVRDHPSHILNTLPTLPGGAEQRHDPPPVPVCLQGPPDGESLGKQVHHAPPWEGDPGSPVHRTPGGEHISGVWCCCVPNLQVSGCEGFGAARYGVAVLGREGAAMVCAVVRVGLLSLAGVGLDASTRPSVSAACVVSLTVRCSGTESAGETVPERLQLRPGIEVKDTGKRDPFSQALGAGAVVFEERARGIFADCSHGRNYDVHAACAPFDGHKTKTCSFGLHFSIAALKPSHIARTDLCPFPTFPFSSSPLVFANMHSLTSPSQSTRRRRSAALRASACGTSGSCSTPTPAPRPPLCRWPRRRS